MEKKLDDDCAVSEEIDPELTNPMQEVAKLEEEDLGYSLNMMSSLYNESPSGDEDELIIEPVPCKGGLPDER